MALLARFLMVRLVRIGSQPSGTTRSRWTRKRLDGAGASSPSWMPPTRYCRRPVRWIAEAEPRFDLAALPLLPQHDRAASIEADATHPEPYPRSPPPRDDHGEVHRAGAVCDNLFV